MKMKEIAEKVGSRIKELREQNKETQNDLAQILNCAQNNISKIEGGTCLTLESLLKIATHYNVSMDYLCTGKGGPDLLGTLNQYIKYRWAPITGLDGVPEKKHLIPHIYINKAFYNCLYQIARAECTADIPYEAVELWKSKAVTDFNNSIISDKCNDNTEFILLETSVLAENEDIIKLLEKHITE